MAETGMADNGGITGKSLMCFQEDLQVLQNFPVYAELGITQIWLAGAINL